MESLSFLTQLPTWALVCMALWLLLSLAQLACGILQLVFLRQRQKLDVSGTLTASGADLSAALRTHEYRNQRTA